VSVGKRVNGCARLTAPELAENCYCGRAPGFVTIVVGVVNAFPTVPKSLHVLLVEDSLDDALLVQREIERTGWAVTSERVEEAETMRAALAREHRWDIILSDWGMPRFNALDALYVLKETGLDIPFIIVSGSIGEEAAVSALRAGARDFVPKDRLSRLAPAIQRELRESEVRRALGRTEEQLRQSQKMEAVGRLAGGVAHDFNNVLSVILGYGEMLLADMKPGDPMRADVEEIRRAGKRAADLTRQLLMFSREHVIEPRVLDLNEVLTGMDKMLQRILGADVELVSRPTQPLGRVRVDPSSMEQVIMNLVVNARDAMPTGGKLTMETDNVVLDEAYAREHLGVTPGPHVMLAVTDTGEGIDKTTLARIFEPFFTTKEKGKGTGLGLSTVFGIVQQSGGSIWVYSEPGKGTTFKVYLPVVDAAVETLRSVESATTLRGSETILLVEDDDQVRAVARGILGRNGYHVIEARNAGEALLQSERHGGTIHLLLSDVIMPQMSGPELAKRLASSRGGMKVLCMSGYTDDSIVRHGVLDARIAYLQKPLTPETLTRKVREVLDDAGY
jgi:two-component system cell cycle sensor histidine kinase/response regulator CckA